MVRPSIPHKSFCITHPQWAEMIGAVEICGKRKEGESNTCGRAVVKG
jgi:hypothetical protein